MFKNFVVIAFRDLMKHKTHTAINLIGLAVAVALCLLIVLFIHHELSYDEFHAKKDRIYNIVPVMPQRAGMEAYRTVPVPLGPALENSMPGVATTTRWIRAHVILRAGDHVSDEVVTYVDREFFSIFTYPLLRGDSASALEEVGGMILTRDKAVELFGHIDIVGKPLTYSVAGETHSALVSAVVENPPTTSSLTFSILQNIEAYPWIDRYRDHWQSWRCLTFALMKPGADPGDVERASSSFMHSGLPEDDEPVPADDSLYLVLTPMTDYHLNLAGRINIATSGNIDRSYILGGIAALVLVIACINYIILALGMTAGRTREVGMRKVLGAVPGQLRRQFIVEALIMAGLAVGVGVALAELMLPTFNQLTGKAIESSMQAGWVTIAALVGLALTIGLVAGSAPATVLSRTKPIQALKGQFGMVGIGRFSWLLVAVQFALTIFLIFGSITIARQMHYIGSVDLGYHPENLLVIPTHASAEGVGETMIERLRVAIADNADVVDVSGTAMAFTEGTNQIRWGDGTNDDLWAYEYQVDPEYIETMGIQVVQGRDFDPTRTGERNSAVIINETALRQYGIAGVGDVVPELKLEKDGPPATVIGVVKDHNFLSLREEVAPMILHTNSEEWMQYILVRITGDDIATTMSALQATWTELFPNVPYEADFLDDMLLTQYSDERRWQQVTLAASILAVIIACMGLFGQVTLTIARRTKEIGIRKVLGASVAGVTVLLSKMLILRIAVAGLIACAAAYYVMTRWLEQFPYRISLGPESFILAVGAALLVALVTVSIKTIRAARSNPVESLRYE